MNEVSCVLPVYSASVSCLCVSHIIQSYTYGSSYIYIDGWELSCINSKVCRYVDMDVYPCMSWRSPKCVILLLLSSSSFFLLFLSFFLFLCLRLDYLCVFSRSWFVRVSVAFLLSLGGQLSREQKRTALQASHQLKEFLVSVSQCLSSVSTEFPYLKTLQQYKTLCSTLSTLQQPLCAYIAALNEGKEGLREAGDEDFSLS